MRATFSLRSYSVFGLVLFVVVFLAFSALDWWRYFQTNYLYFACRALFLFSIACIYAGRAVVGDTLPGGLLGYWVAVVHTFFPLLLLLIDAPTDLSALAILGLIGGLTVAALGLVDLGGSFEIAPANRGVKCDGLYRFVRHPMYLGYLVSFTSICLAQRTLLHFVIWTGYLVVTCVRISLEEAELCKDRDFVSYSKQVKFKLIPFLL